MKLSGVFFFSFFQNTRKNFKLNLVLVLVSDLKLSIGGAEGEIWSNPIFTSDGPSGMLQATKERMLEINSQNLTC